MATLLPETRIAVISCDEDEEDIPIERHIDLAALTFDATNTRRVRRSSLGAGIALAMKLTEDAFKYGVAERVVMVVIADGAAKSIIRNPVDLCGTDALNSDLIDSAMSMQLKAKELTLAGFKFKSVIIDNSEAEVSEVEWTEGGTRLAAASGAEYYHIPELTGSVLRR